jgi:Mce-associated membrane protein
VIGALAAAVIIAAVTISGVVFITDQTARRAQIREAAVLSFVRTFITQYTSPDPFNANDYADKVLALGTGNFAKMYSERMNEVVIQVPEPSVVSAPFRRSASSGGTPTAARV